MASVTMSHPYLKIRLPSNAPFELRPSPGKGWGGFATKNIARGDLILNEAPLFVIDTTYSRAVVEADIIKGFTSLAPADKQEFSYARSNGDSSFGSLWKAFEENSFQSPDGPLRALYLLSSRFNHSCIPNVRSPLEYVNACRKMVAAKDICIGEEIVFCYSPSAFQAMTRHERHKISDFTCDCKACCLGTPYQKISDTRTRFIRGVHYILRGVGLDGLRDTSAAPLICNPTLKVLAETGNLPLSVSFISLLLFICLCEAEGTLDDGDVKAQEKDLRDMVATFRTSKNIAVAKRAVAQSTWPARFCVALGLWKVFDQADFYITMMRSMSRFQR